MEALVITMSENLDEPVSSLLTHIDESLIAKSSAVIADRTKSPLTVFADSVQQRPGQLAVVSDAGTLTFSELEKQSNKVANSIASAVAVIGVCIPASLESIVHRLGIFKSSKTYLAIGENLPANRKRLIARSLEADVVYTTKEYAKEFALLGEDKVIVVDEESYKHSLASVSAEAAKPQNTTRAAITLANGQFDTHKYSIWSTEQLFEQASLVADRLETKSSSSNFLNWIPGSEFDCH